MTRSYLRRAIALLTLALLAPLAIPASAAGATPGHTSPAGERTYLVTLENLSAGQPFTPPVLATHRNRTSIWSEGEPASPGIQAVAENGDVPTLAAEVAANPRVGDSFVADADGPVLPGQSITFEITSQRGNRNLSLASMLVCTNDGFTGVDSLRLPTRAAQSTEYFLDSYDAGTERNTELFSDIVPPCGPLSGVDSGGQGTGASDPALAENGVITRHGFLEGTGDLDLSVHQWSDPVAKLTVTRIDNAAEYEVTVRNNSSGQPLTPPVFAAHRNRFDLFDSGEEASAGIAGLAENGDVPGLVAELAEADGVVTVAVGNGPVLGGEEQTFTVYTRRGVRRFSFASMLICTNDGFAGVNRDRLPRWIGDTKWYGANSYDAGTELNTELFSDIVPPCGPLSGVDSGGQGTGASDPALAENGVITRHGFLEGTGDLSADVHQWSDPVAELSITRVR